MSSSTATSDRRAQRVHAHAVLGDLPQDLSFTRVDTRLDIGDDNVLREGVTVHRATRVEAPTRIGSHCFLMAYVHVAHDCRVGDRVILTNNVASADTSRSATTAPSAAVPACISSRAWARTR